MKVFVICYDLNRPGQNYDSLFDAIKAISGYWCHAVDSTWFIASSMSAAQIRDKLLPHIDSNDDLLVSRQSGEAAWYGLSDEISDWLKKQLGNAVAV